MKLAFCLFKYFPYGGLQRDFLRIAHACKDRGHEIHVYTMRWDGEVPADFSLHLIPAKGLQNHTRSKTFAREIEQVVKANAYDLVVGFNKMPNLDLYYAADVCYQARVRENRSIFYRLLPRYREWLGLEESVFAKGKKTHVMLISALQEPLFTHYYQTEKRRFHLLPPGIAKDRIAPANAAEIRQKVRSEFNIPENHFMLMMVGSGFKTKGLDRAIKALAALPKEIKERCHFYVIGQDDAKPFLRLAKRLSVSQHLHFLGGRKDVPELLLAGDMLLHPAYHENTGTVLLEAMLAGLPVLTVDVCGYAHYVKEANMGQVLKSPFNQLEFNQALADILVSADDNQWKLNSFKFAKTADIFSLPEKAADLIEKLGQKT